MGMFDRVYVDCKCGGHAEFQSKAGHCILDEFDLDNMPICIAEDINGSTEHCDRCGKSCTIKCKFICIADDKWE